MSQTVIREGRLLLVADAGCGAATPVPTDHPDYERLRATALDLDALAAPHPGDEALTARLRARVTDTRRTA
ncbi:hypothetical protein GCM10009678_82750 [Actinomadura kijaniata]|uniref:Uncharacterized protein n=1 Tax=Actinomadura namibiensis TaxID=182080 RepID=A0A7W3M004_ACTNM|nr:hypothetical protein [Actinomadura namibiensis]MBA8957466.1 hypothetical protein [Actinomadura namibiensis]